MKSEPDKKSEQDESHKSIKGMQLPSSLQALIDRAGRDGQASAPVEHWEPDYCGDIDMRIASDGTWYYMGTPITRERLVRLFATVLRKDADEQTYLVTPVEKIGIHVDDAPFLAIEMHHEGRGHSARITCRTNVNDVVTIGPKHPIRFETDPQNGGLKPYVLIRGRLEALLARPLVFELISYAVEYQVDDVLQFGIWSDNMFFPIAPVSELREAEFGEPS